MDGTGHDPKGVSGPREGGGPAVSVVVACTGRPAAVHCCLASVLRHSRRPWHLVVVVRSERDAVGAYAAGVRDAAPVPVDLVVAPAARSARTAWRDGLAKGSGEFVAPVGPGVVVTDAWLDQLVALAGADPANGLVAPVSDPRAFPTPAPETGSTPSRGAGATSVGAGGPRPTASRGSAS
jgi:Glycosyl transferase family 2